MLQKLKVKNWEQYQHYKDRNPRWIKLHSAVLSSKDWVTLDNKSRVLLVACMLIASQGEEAGVIDADPDFIKRVAYLNEKPDFNPLIKCGFLIPVSNASILAHSVADARPEESRVEESRVEENTMSGLNPDGEPPIPVSPQEKVPITEIINHLNATAGTAFKATVKTTRGLIKARWQEGHRLPDFLAVISHKADEWLGDAKMQQFVRPQTLFGTKFESYLQAAKAAGHGENRAQRGWVK